MFGDVCVFLRVILLVVKLDGRDVTGDALDVIPGAPFDIVVPVCDHREAHVAFAVRRNSRVTMKLTEGGGFPFSVG